MSSLPSGRRVILVLQGGLGNQLFQLCAGELIRKKTGYAVSYDCDLGFRHDSFGQRFELAHLIPLEHRSAPPPGNGLWRTVFQERLSVTVEQNLMWRRGISSIPLEMTMRMVRWWPASEVVCRSCFQLLGYLDPETVERARTIMGLRHAASPADEVAVHFRRGRHRNQKGDEVPDLCGTILSVDYYREALRRVRAELGLNRFRIFSDTGEIPANVFDPGDTVVLDRPTPQETPSDTLVKMARHRTFIIANSTFSWWAAYLSTAAKKRVYAPKIWQFNDWAPSQKGIFPDEWNRI